MVLALFVFFADCRASCSPTSIVVAISPRSAFVGSGQTLHFAATVTAHPSSSFHRREKGRCGYRGGSPEDDRRGDASDVTWSISGSSSGSIDAQGNYPNRLLGLHGGLGIVILSTSHGVMSGQQATKQGLGGEVVCYVW